MKNIEQLPILSPEDGKAQKVCLSNKQVFGHGRMTLIMRERERERERVTGRQRRRLRLKKVYKLSKKQKEKGWPWPDWFWNKKLQKTIRLSMMQKKKKDGRTSSPFTPLPPQKKIINVMQMTSFLSLECVRAVQWGRRVWVILVCRWWSYVVSRSRLSRPEQTGHRWICLFAHVIVLRSSRVCSLLWSRQSLEDRGNDEDPNMKEGKTTTMMMCFFRHFR